MTIDSRWKAFAALCMLGLALAFIYARRPVPGALPICPFHVLTGWYCPGCGALRAIHQLLHGHLLAAVGLNPLMMLILPVLAYEPARWLRMVSTGKPWPELAPPPWATRSLVCVILVYWVARNIPAAPFLWLAP